MHEEHYVISFDNEPIRIKFFENEEHEEELTVPSCRPKTMEDLIKEVMKFSPDMIFADYDLPSIDGHSTFTIMRENFPEVPFVFINGTFEKEFIFEPIKIGAKIMFLKTKLEIL